MSDQVNIKTEVSVDPSSLSSAQGQIVDQRDLAVLWAIGILVSLLLSFAGANWQPARYEARQSESVDATEARVENSQNKMVTDALNHGDIEYNDSMDALVMLKPVYVIIFYDFARLSLFPTGPLLILGLLFRRSMLQMKARKSLNS